MFTNIINGVKMWTRSPTYQIIQFKLLINWLLMACGRRHFEAPEWWCHVIRAISPEVCITHLRACKQGLAKNNSRIKRNNLAKFSHISFSQKNLYKMKMILNVSKKARGELGTLTGVYVNSVYSWPRWRQSIRLFSFPPSNLTSGTAVMAALQ